MKNRTIIISAVVLIVVLIAAGLAYTYWQKQQEVAQAPATEYAQQQPGAPGRRGYPAR